MTIFTCDSSWESMQSCIYDAFASKLGQQNIKLMVEPVYQYTLFDEYIHVDPDEEKATKLRDTICERISYKFYWHMMYTAQAYEEDVLDNIYRCLILGFHYGTSALERVQYEFIMRNQEIRKRLGREINRFQEAIRFHQIRDVYIAHIEPKSDLIVSLGPIFEDRMPSECFVIVDDIHKKAIVHPKDEASYLMLLSDKELERLMKTEDANDEYTYMWKSFFDAVAIEERKNPKCQLNHSPLWARKHIIEFNI